MRPQLTLVPMRLAPPLLVKRPGQGCRDAAQLGLQVAEPVFVVALYQLVRGLVLDCHAALPFAPSWRAHLALAVRTLPGCVAGCGRVTGRQFTLAALSMLLRTLRRDVGEDQRAGDPGLSKVLPPRACRPVQEVIDRYEDVRAKLVDGG
jgi:hypothetical protein